MQSFDDSRRLTGPNLHFAACGAVLEVLGADAVTPELEQAWRANVAWARTALRWPDGDVVVRRHATGVDRTCRLSQRQTRASPSRVATAGPM